MYGNKEIISYLQSNKILALKLDHAVSAVGQQVTNQIETLGKGATRLLYYTSCFTDEYNDVCQRQKTEDLRFRDAVYKVIRHGDVVYDMLRLYYSALYVQGLEMLYFLIEPVFQKAGAVEAQWASTTDIVGIISRMIKL